MFGRAEFEQANALLNRKLGERGMLVVSHRGAAVGSAAQNTALAVRGALLSGADMVEIDACAAADGVYFAFHDGTEPEQLGIEENLQTLTSEQIDKLRYLRVDRPGRPATVERLLPLLEEFKGDVLFNIDRSWWRWPILLNLLDTLAMPAQLVLKCPAWDESALTQLERHPVKYPFVPICASPEDADRVIDSPDLNTVGLELLTETPLHPWFQRDVIEGLHERGVFTMVSTVTLNTGIPLFGGLDDELALLEGLDAAFGPLVTRGIDAIQTDWPWLLRSYLDSLQPEPRF
ncbi:MAG: glycerophosphodiester phosphodiesterase family protein [Propionibacteriaceae bacterium]|jgi:glycerophosphoryl diester phosphodiesterase|nr:glycerophosphodiester phosphodiesterase family protein [Propionibacteriaceae bacterium]